jgi:predicted N-acetyltransferase YhbS
MLEIVNVKEYGPGIDKAVDYIHGIWGSEQNYSFYKDAIHHSSLPGKPLPQFFLLLKNEEIIGCSALITNDFISRHDLYPWMACLYVAETERGNQYGNLLMKHVEQETKKAGFSNLYLTTHHDGYYEKYGWKRIEDGIDLFSGQPSRIYLKEL